MIRRLFENSKNVLFVSPHPDDVELCCGMLIKRLLSNNVRVYYVCITNGAPTPEILSKVNRIRNDYNQWVYMIRRKRETLMALRFLGIKRSQIFFWNYPDLECHININTLVQHFSRVVKLFDTIFCCPFEGGHPDHDTIRLALGVSINDVKYSGKLFEYASYNTLGYHIFQSNLPESFIFKASVKEKEIKKQILKKFISQKEVIKQFSDEIECFREMDLTFNSKDFLSYPLEPYYEQWAFSKCEVLNSIKEYLSSEHHCCQ